MRESNHSLHDKAAFWAVPRSAAGRWSAILMLVAITALIVVNLVADRADGFRVAFALVFSISGAAALVAAVRGLRHGDRSAVVWLAGVVGTLVALLTLGELFVFE